MPEEVKEATPPPAQPAPAPVPAAKPPKPTKPDKVKVCLIGAGSVNYEGIILRKNETVTLEASRAEQLLKSGMFTKQ